MIDVSRDEPMDTLAEVCRAVRVRTGADEDAEAQAQRLYELALDNSHQVL